MITFAEESLANVKEEIQPLIEMHWEQVALNQGKIKLNPDWEEYARLYFNGALKIYTARDDCELVGYFVVTVSRSAHYKDHIFAICDVIFVKPDKRAGMTGYKLIKYAQNSLKKNGVSLLNINTKVHVPFDKLLQRMGFNLIERIYSKYIGS